MLSASEKLKDINVVEDTVPFLEKLLSLKDGEIFVGSAKFDGKFKLLELNLKTA